LSLPYSTDDLRLSRLVGLALVVALHIGIVYALVTGLATRAVEVIPAAIEAKIISEPPHEQIEPPPPPPEFHPPPPPFVPPPEVHIETPAPPRSTAITTVTNVKPMEPPPAPPREPVTVMPRIDLAHSHQPEYPPVSRRLGEQGSVILQVLVSVGGRVLDAKVVQSSGSERLDQAAVAGVKEDYRFTPATLDGKPQQMWYTFKFTWKLQ